jgi:pterin-4a-carbinolamine dehydratase
MMTLKKLHESFIERSERPMSFGNLPVEPKKSVVPIIAIERWQKIGKCIVKTFMFMEQSQRNDFIKALLDYELQVQHNASMTINESNVELTLCTKDVDEVTSLDKEYASFADTVFKDVVRSSAW